ncbi:MAG TPA: efflux RND transporter periplasmic adaptor subunit [Paracoccus sp.]|nr:efflux RND transporter periplasmic adaptor subunit [Paracoccus sp. (in: a-proteobacteria)]
MRKSVRMMGQAVLVALVAAAAVVAWAMWLPASHPILDRAGLLEPMVRLGVPLAQEAQISGPVAGAGGMHGPLVVTTAPVVQAELSDRIAAIGTGEAVHSVVLLPEVSGRLAEIRVRAGDRVQAGTVIARLDSDAEQIARDRAALLLDEARATAERLARLQASGTATEVQIREASLAVRTAELGVRQAEFDLSRREIVAPITGWIGIIAPEVGAQITPNTAIARIDDRSMILVDFSVPERLVGRIAPGDPLNLTLLARSDEQLEGRIRTIDSRVDQASRSLRVVGELANPDDTLRAGMAFSIAMTLPGTLVPAVDPLAIQWGNEGSFVWAVREGRVTRVPVRILQRSEGVVLVRGALEPGEHVVREGVQSLREGSEVQDHAQPVIGGVDEDGAERASADSSASKT